MDRLACLAIDGFGETLACPGRLLRGVLGEARAGGTATATLVASDEGRGVYERLGFRTVAMLRASVAGG